MISIRLESPTGMFEAGAEINSRVLWSDMKKTSDSIEARLIWYTRGKGDRDVHVFDTVVINPASDRGEQRFQFIAPSQPYSFSGKLISLIWAIEAIEFPNHDAVQLEIVIAPDGNEILLKADPLE